MFCKTCGKEISDEAVVCPECGCLTHNEAVTTESEQAKKGSKTSTILGIIGIVTGIKEYKETGKMTGLVLSIIGEACAIFSSIVGAVSFASIL
ncbi:MAG: zinc ribbon domain-containing protein [Clostridia bacterium]|nr:zinc ribbon domain-containing protein [Clostridia bacterium]